MPSKSRITKRLLLSGVIFGYLKLGLWTGIHFDPNPGPPVHHTLWTRPDWTSGPGLFITPLYVHRDMYCVACVYVQIHMHMYIPTFFLQKAAKNRLFTCDQKQKSFRIACRKMREARGKKQQYKKLPTKWFKQWHIKHGDCIIYPRPCGKNKKQEARTTPESPKPALPNPTLAVCPLSYIQHEW